MRRFDVKRTNEEAIQNIIQLARTGLVRSMPHRKDGEWQIVVRWTSPFTSSSKGMIDHLEPQSFGNDAASENTGKAGPDQAEMKRISQAINNVVLGAVERHAFGRLSIKVSWRDSLITTIEHSICESRKVEAKTEAV
jgi:hypothetical protein